MAVRMCGVPATVGEIWTWILRAYCCRYRALYRGWLDYFLTKAARCSDRECGAAARIVADRAAPLSRSHKPHLGHRKNRVSHDEVIKETDVDKRESVP
jgi:hypothetical protein